MEEEPPASLTFKLGEDYTSPVYIQRYQAVAEVLKLTLPNKKRVKKVADFGCAELNFFKYLKNISEVNEVNLIDIDENLLKGSSYKARPLTYDYLHRREECMTVRVLCGSVAEKDDCLLEVDAVTCIELIEHLESEILQQVPSVIFGHIHPQIAVFTTPNSDFNILFPDLKGFRHWDHKFEWTRQEFSEWCKAVIRQYPDYKYEIKGVGNGPTGSEHLGCCSQMAIFTNQNFHHQHRPSLEQCSSYSLIDKYYYPAKIGNKLSREESIAMSAEYYIRRYGNCQLKDEDEDTVMLPLKMILNFTEMRQYECTDKELRALLTNNGWTVLEENEQLVVRFSRETKDGSSDEHSEYDSENEEPIEVVISTIDNPEEDWDL